MRARDSLRSPFFKKVVERGAESGSSVTVFIPALPALTITSTLQDRRLTREILGTVEGEAIPEPLQILFLQFVSAGEFLDLAVSLLDLAVSLLKLYVV